MGLDIIKKTYGFRIILSAFNSSLMFGFEKLPNCTVLGLESKCHGNKNIVMADYDKVDENFLDETLQHLINKFSLSPFYVFETERTEVGEKKVLLNVLAVSLTKLPFGDVVSVLKASSCDKNFILAPLYQFDKAWAIRLTSKGTKPIPKFLKIIGNENLDREISGSHLKILNLWYHLPPLNYTNIDDSDDVILTKYKTIGD